MTRPRQSTGIPALDSHLGGGLLPGTLTVVVGATGIGKTQLGLQYARAGLGQEGRPGIFFDMTARGDAQSHRDYAERMFDWKLEVTDPANPPPLGQIFRPEMSWGDYLRIFDYSGRRVTRKDLDWDEWHAWQGEWNARLATAISFFYGNFVRGTRRVVVDGIEPVERSGESIQFHLFEYVYHQVLRKESDWVARDLFRQDFRAKSAEVEKSAYPFGEIGGLLLVTSPETMLEPLLEKPLDNGDLLAVANTLIFMGRVRREGGFSRAMAIAKHRGSPCSESFLPYTIGGHGLQME